MAVPVIEPKTEATVALFVMDVDFNINKSVPQANVPALIVTVPVTAVAAERVVVPEALFIVKLLHPVK